MIWPWMIGQSVCVSNDLTMNDRLQSVCVSNDLTMNDRLQSVCVFKKNKSDLAMVKKNGRRKLISSWLLFYREHFGCHHPKYSDALLDYGFYLLNVDSITAAVQVYQVSGLFLYSGTNNCVIFFYCRKK